MLCVLRDAASEHWQCSSRYSRGLASLPGSAPTLEPDPSVNSVLICTLEACCLVNEPGDELNMRSAAHGPYFPSHGRQSKRVFRSLLAFACHLLSSLLHACADFLAGAACLQTQFTAHCCYLDIL